MHALAHVHAFDALAEACALCVESTCAKQQGVGASSPAYLPTYLLTHLLTYLLTYDVESTGANQGVGASSPTRLDLGLLTYLKLTYSLTYLLTYLLTWRAGANQGESPTRLDLGLLVGRGLGGVAEDESPLLGAMSGAGLDESSTLSSTLSSTCTKSAADAPGYSLPGSWSLRA